MKKTLLASVLSIAFATGMQAQTTVKDSVTLGTGYANQSWYGLAHGEVKQAPKDNWDIAFEAVGYAAPILVNTQKGNTLLQTPFAVAQWGSVDTTTIATWQQLVDSDTDWSVGAFNNAPASQVDLGWGTYNQTTHVVAGDSIYLLKLAGGAVKKIMINSLTTGVYSFTYSNLDGTDSLTKTVTKSQFATKNFAYFSLTTNDTLDREPVSADWDLTFVKYTTVLFIPTPYIQSVTGVLANKGIRLAKETGDVADSLEVDTTAFVPDINTIGYNWKSFTGGTYVVQDSTAYFAEVANGDIYKIIFTGFDMSNGKFNFSKELLLADTTSVPTGINEVKAIGTVAIYPNPSNGQDVTLIYSVKNDQTAVNLTVTDLSGRAVYTGKLATQAGLYTQKMPTEKLEAGIYIVTVEGNGTTVQQKLIVQ